MPPRAPTADDLGLVEPDHRFGEGIDAPICQDCCGCSSGDLAARCAGAVVVDEGVVDFTRDESLQAADDVFLGQPLTGASDNVVEGRLVPAHADDHDPVECRVGLAVASAEEPVPVRDPGRGGDPCMDPIRSRVRQALWRLPDRTAVRPQPFFAISSSSSRIFFNSSAKTDGGCILLCTAENRWLSFRRRSSRYTNTSR